MGRHAARPRGLTAAGQIDADRVIADLRELARRTSDDAGAQRVAWTQTWHDARAFLGELLEEIGATSDTDEAGNLWAGWLGSDPSAPAVVVGSHLDSVPNGGYPQRPVCPIAFGNIDPPYSLPSVGLLL